MQRRFLIHTIETGGISGKRGMKAPKARKFPGEAAKALQAAMTQLEADRGSKDLDTSVMSTNLDPVYDSDGEGKHETNPNAAATSVKAEGVDPALLCVAVTGPGRTCKTKKSTGSQYCWRHAPLDPNSSSTYCRFADPDTHKKCTQVIQKTKKPLLCNTHLSKVTLFIGDDSVMNGATDADVAAAMASNSKSGENDNVDIV